MEAKFTPQQQAAIECSAKNILVSAAAGSGKTAVLTERIMNHVKNKININELLIVTFTEAASAEMKERITDRLATIDPHQITLLPTADISTIHSFCLKLIRENFTTLNIDPAFRVGDDGELSLLRTAVMDELFEAEYEQENNAHFLDLADVYGGKATDGRLDALIRKIHDFMESDPFPQEAAKRYAAAFNTAQINSIDNTPWAKIAIEELTLGLEGVIEGLKQAISICHAPEGPIKYAPTLEAELEEIEHLHETTINNTFEKIYSAFQQITWSNLPAIRAKDEVNVDLKTRVQRIRDKAVKEKIKSLTKGIFFAPPDKMKSDLTALAPRVNALMELAIRFSKNYSKEKREKNILDFTDLEHYAINVLYPNGPDDLTPNTEISKYYEVLVDEYQDSNAVQDMILSAVSERRFMVGDVKQSIYRFRRANPGLFKDKYLLYNLYNRYEAQDNVRIDLSHNFRSRPEVLNAVNFFFSQLMCNEVGEVEYDHQAALHQGFDDNKYPKPTIEMQVEILDQAEPDIYKEEDDEETQEESISNVIAETRIIAKNIQNLLKKNTKLSDIAILTRGLSSMAAEIIEELKNHGIEAVADTNASFFEQQEIKTALAFLKITDNPLQDIELITALTSPVYDLTPDELLEIRQCPLEPIENEESNFYHHLITHAQKYNNQKVHTFLAHLKSWRSASVHTPISRLIGIIYDTTQYPAHVLNQPGGNIRQANLRLLLERAIEFEETGLKGLFHFINYIERLSETEHNLSTATETTSKNCVKLMTIHKSKGLEFPVVFCSFLGKKFNIDNERQPVILHSEKGVGPYYINTALRTRSNTLARFSLARLTRRESLSEELRCLYVAMTRAKNLIILTGRSKNLQKSMEKWADYSSHQQTNLPVYYRRGVTSYLDWLMPCLLRHNSAKNLIKESKPALNIYNHPAKFNITIHHPTAPSYTETKIQKEEVKSTILAPLPMQMSTPSKLSITEIKRLYDITPDTTNLTDTTPPPIFEAPNFIKNQTTPTPMEIGSALHTVAEHINYHTHTTIEAIEALINELITKNLITPETAICINRKKILTLVKSPLANRLRNATQINRETPFILSIPASEIYTNTTETENILVHGIIDCYFQEGNEIVLLDYKSDANPDAHAVQMNIYKKAITHATGLNVKEVLIYSFALGKVIPLTDNNN